MHRITRNLALPVAAAALAVCGGHSPSSAQQAPQPNSVTYVGSSGFLIRAGGKKILIDAVFDGFPGGYALPDSVRQPLLAGRAPFDGIDLVLATHDHGDHFSAASVRRVLQSSPGAAFVGPAAAVTPLADLGDRARALDVPEGERRALEVNGITVAAMRLSHGNPPPGNPGIVNLAYAVTAGGLTFFHTGDIDLGAIPREYFQALGFPADHVDVAFVPHFLLSVPGPAPFVTEWIRPRFVVPSHIQYTGGAPDYEQILTYHPNAMLFRTEMESRPIQ